MTEFHARYGGYGVMIYWHAGRRFRLGVNTRST
jgi:TnpA family transposase